MSARPLHRLPVLAALLALVLLLFATAPVHAACEAEVCVSAGQRPSDAGDPQAVLLDTVLSALTGEDVALTQAEYAGLSLGAVNLGELGRRLQAQTGAASVEEALNSNVTLSELYAAAASVAAANGDTVSASAFDALAGQVSGNAATLAVGDLVAFEPGGGLDTDLNALALVTGSAQLVNRNNLLLTPPPPVFIDAAALGLDGLAANQVGLQIAVIDSPQLVCGPQGSTFRSAAMRVKLSIALPGNSSPLPVALPNGDPTLSLTELNVYVDIGATEGVVTLIDALAQSVTVQATPGLTNVHLGEIDDSVFFSASPLSFADFAPATVGTLTVPGDALTGDTVVDVQLRSSTDGQSTTTETLVFNGPFPETQTVGASAGDLSGAAGQLIDNLEVFIEPSPGPALDSRLGRALETAVGTELDALLGPAFDSAIDPLLDALGAKPGAVPVTVEGFADNCASAQFSGHVYADENRNASRDAGEIGSGEPLWIKLFDEATPDAPAHAVIAVDPASGVWQADVESGAAYRVVLSTNADPADRLPGRPAGWTGTERPDGLRSNVVSSGAAATGLDFGLYRGQRLTGTVFRDNGAAANDGVQQADEPGLAGVTVQLRVADGGDLLDSTLTIGTGEWQLWIPAGADGLALQVVVQAPAGFEATGGSPGDSGGSYSREDDRVTFTAQPGQDVQGMAFGEVPPNRLEASGETTAEAGSVVFFGHRYVAGTAGSVEFSTAGRAAPEDADWRSLVYLDADCNGRIDAGDEVANAAVTLQADDALCLVQKIFVPSNARDGAAFSGVLAADFTADGGAELASRLTQVDRVSVGSGGAAGLVLRKAVDRAQARVGDRLVYTIEYDNPTARPLQQIVVRDATPAYTVFVDAECAVPAPGLAGCSVTQAPAVGDSGSIVWSLDGELPPGASGLVRFSVVVR